MFCGCVGCVEVGVWEVVVDGVGRSGHFECVDDCVVAHWHAEELGVPVKRVAWVGRQKTLNGVYNARSFCVNWKPPKHFFLKK